MLSTIFALLAPTLLAQSSTPSALELVPADAFLVAHVDNLPLLRERIQQSSFTRLFTAQDGLLPQQNLAQILPFLNPHPTAEELEALPTEPRQWLEALNGLEGSATFYLTAISSPGTPSGQDPVGVLLLHPTGSSSAFKAQIEGLMKDQAEITFLERGGLEVAVPTRSLTDPEAFEAGMIFAPGLFALTIGEGNAKTKAEFERLLLRIGGGEGQSIPSNPRYQAAQASLRTQGQVNFFLDLMPLMDQLMAEQASNTDLPIPADELFAKLGLGGLSYVAGRMSVGQLESIDMEFFVPYQRKSWIGMLADHLQATTLEHLKRVPEEAITVSGGFYDLEGLFDDALEIAEALSPGSSELVRGQLSSFSSSLGFDIEADLIQQFDGHMLSYSRSSTASQASPGAAALSLLGLSELPSTYVFSLKETDTLRDSLISLVDFAAEMSASDFALEEYASGDQKLWRLSGSDLPMELPLAIGFSTEEQGPPVMVVALNSEDAAMALRNPASRASSVLDNKKLGPVLRANVGRGPIAVGDSAKTLETLISTLEGLFNSGRELMDEFDQGPGLAEAEGWLNQMDPSAIGRYLHGTGLQVLELNGSGLRLNYQSR